MTSQGHTVQLGRIVVVPLREVWVHEAHDFTPWLLANADVLSDVLGMDLELSHAEHPVGGFSLDLIGRDTATGDSVIVENQLETSDHVHLGQLLTYAGGTDARNIVWVASAFRDEHRAALDWLNGRTDENTRFFGVEVSAVRIGSSPPAPLLTLVVAPNEWNKTIKETSHPEGERAATYREFWVALLHRVRTERPTWTRATKGSNVSWINLPTGTSGVAFGMSFTRRGLCSEIYYGAPAADVNTARFGVLAAHRGDADQAFGAPLDWQDLPGRKACRVAAYMADASVEDRAAWTAYMDWFIDTQDRLRGVYATFGSAPTHR